MAYASSFVDEPFEGASVGEASAWTPPSAPCEELCRAAATSRLLDCLNLGDVDAPSSSDFQKLTPCTLAQKPFYSACVSACVSTGF